MEKRRFYNTGDAKGFTKANFFQGVADLVAGNEVDPATVALIGAAAEYELEGIAGRAAKGATATGERKDPLQSEYAVALANALVPLVTAEPQTAKQLIEAATAKGMVAPSGKEFAAPWASRVLNAHDAVTSVKVIVETVDSKGLKSQKEATAYVKA